STAPVGANSAGIDRRDVTERWARRSRIAGEGVAVTLAQIRVVVSQVEGEHLPSEAETNVPRVVVRVRYTVGVNAGSERTAVSAVESIAGAEPLTAELTGHVPTERTECHFLRRGELDGAGQIFAVGAGVQEVRGVIEVRAERPIGPGVGNFSIDLVEAGDRFCHVAVIGNATADATRIESLRRAGAVALTARMVVVPVANIEQAGPPRRTDTAVEVDFRRRVVGELDALTGDASVELPVRIDVVARLEIGRDRRPVTRLGYA